MILPRQSTHIYVLASNKSDKDSYIDMFSQLSQRIQTLKQNGDIVRNDERQTLLLNR
jgi:hypothetical protein